MIRSELFLLGLLVLFGSARAGAETAVAPLRLAFTAVDVDWERTVEQPANAEVKGFAASRQDQLERVFGLKTPPAPLGGWHPGSGTGPRSLLLAFHKPIALGTILGSEGVQVALLRPEAPYPGAVENTEHWKTIAPTGTGKGTPLWLLEPGVKTRALCFTVTKPEGGLQSVRVLSGRFFNLTPEAVASADSVQGDSDAERRANAAANLVTSGRWLGGDGRAIDAKHPQHLMLAWAKPIDVHALALVDPFFKKAELQSYVGDEKSDPAHAPETAWQTREAIQVTPHLRAPKDVTLALRSPLRTRALRLRITETFSDEDDDIKAVTKGRADRVSLDGIHVLTHLGDRPPPASTRLPLRLEYVVDRPGKVVLAVNDATGRRVRNLIAEADRQAGANVEFWDGRDDRGRLVPPGEYRFEGALTPPVGLFYEFTVNNAGDPPWWKQDVWEPRREPGGWIADHGSPTDVAAVGDVLFIASDVAEHGHCLIAVDRNGKKLWGAKWLQDLAGSKNLASDGKSLYSAGEGGWGGERLQLFAIDPKSFAVRRIVKLDYRAGLHGRPGGLAGLAARDGLVYVSFNSPPHDHTANPLDPAALDMSHTTGQDLQAEQIDGILRAVEPVQPWIGLPLPEREKSVLRFGWTKAQEIGTILSPHRLELAVLKPDAVYPGDVKKDGDWQAFEADLSQPGLKVYTAPPGVKTRALRVRVLNAVEPVKLGEPQGRLTDSTETPEKFTGLRVLAPRLHVVGEKTEIAVSAGQVFPGGAWENRQESEIGADRPALYTVRFARPAAIRALVVRDPFFAAAEVEIQATAGGPWKNAGRMTNKFYWRRAYSDLTFDFHQDVKVVAARLKIIEPALAQNYDVKKRTGETKKVCGLGGVLFLGTRAGDAPPEPDLAQRVSVFRADSGAIVREFPLEAPGGLAFTPDGRLLAVSGNQVVLVPLEGGTPTPIVSSGLKHPTGLTVGPDGSIYVCDAGENVVKQYAAGGKFMRLIGVPGGLENGPYDPRRLSNPRGLTLDSEGRLWVAEHESRPKKISVWSLAGEKSELVKHFLGGPPYGGGFMYIDPKEPSRMFFQGMEFEADWEKGTHRIKNIHWRGGLGRAWGGVTCDRPIYFRDRLYLAGEPHGFYHNQYMALARYDKDRAVPAAAAGLAEKWPPLHAGALRAGMGNPDLGAHSFVWSDLNGDGTVSADEIKLGPKDFKLTAPYWGARVGDDLALQFANWCFAPVRVTDAGVPVYDFDRSRPTPQPLGSSKWTGNSYSHISLTRDDRVIEISPIIAVKPRTGAAPWTYADDYPAVHGSQSAPPPRPGMLVGTLQVIGRAVLPNAGEVFAVGSNKGEIYVFSTDGLFLARLFRDHRAGNCFNLPKAERGMSVGHVSINCEHFGGTFNQLADSRIFLVVGHNHNSVIRVEGLDKIQRFRGTATLTPEQFLAAEKQVSVQSSQQAKPKELAVKRAPAGVKLDGKLNDWQKAEFVPIQGSGAHQGRAALLYDQERLYLAYEVRDTKGCNNRNDDWKMLFKSGDSVDLQLAIDPSAPAGRTEPARGDLRLLLSVFDGKPTAVLYRHVAPDAPADEKSVFASPVGSVTVDSVRKIGAGIHIEKSAEGYTIEAAVPWEKLGAKPASGMKLRGDLGILFADAAGLGVAERLYWSNPETGLVADVPGEIRLHPERWGTLVLE